MLYQTFKDFPCSVGLVDAPLDDDDYDPGDELAYERQIQTCGAFLRSIPERLTRVQFRDQWQSFARINAVADPDEVFAMASEHYPFAEYFRP